MDQLRHVEPGDIAAVVRSALLGCAALWLPLIGLAGAQRVVTGTWDPLVLRSEVHVRLLLSLFLLLCGDASLVNRAGAAARHLVSSRALPLATRRPWEAWVDRIARPRAARWPELLLMAFIFTVTLASYLGKLPHGVLRWLAPSLHDSAMGWRGNTAAWWWYVLIAQPFFLFVVGRWLVRWGIWGATLWRLPAYRPNVQATHADGAGGLAFLAGPLFAYRFMSVGVAAAITSIWFDEIGKGIARPAAFASDFVIFMVATLVIAFAPYARLTPLLIARKREGEHAFSALVRRYVDAFDAKWMRQRRGKILGTSDIQSLADIGNSFKVARDMRTTIPSKRELRAQLTAAILPFLVIILVYTEPASELAKKLFTRLIGG